MDGMNVFLTLLLLLFALGMASALDCYSCSATHRNWTGCESNFIKTNRVFNNSEQNLINCTGENAMCFVRSWSARAHYTWMVQRGCYIPPQDDPLPRSMVIPTRSMSCKFERLTKAEYKVCLCQANWCNRASAVSTGSAILALITVLRLLCLADWG